MKPAEYNTYVNRLEALAREKPQALRVRVRWLIALGYAYVAAALLAVVAAGALLVWLALTAHGAALLLKFLVPVAWLAWFIVKALYIRVQAPEGLPLPAAASARLLERVGEIQRSLSAPSADCILLTDNFNAAVMQVPRLGIFGWPKTYVLLGLPLMLALDRHEFDAVLAHEFAHLSGAHPKLGLWVYRMSRTWQLLLAQLRHSRNWGKRIFEDFVAWYEPRLRAYGFVLSRRDEYEADGDAAQVTSRGAMARALTTMDLRSHILNQEFWPAVWKMAAELPAPTMNTWTVVPELFRDESHLLSREEWVARAGTRRALDDDTHPSLGERLAALGVEGPANILAPLSESAAEYYFAEHATPMVEALEKRWREAVTADWAARHAEVRKARATVEDLSARDGGVNALDTASLFELANAVAELEGVGPAVPHLEQVLDRDPSHVGARFLLGRELLSRGDAAGASHLRQVMQCDPTTAPVCTEVLRRFYAEVGDVEGIAEVQEEQHAWGIQLQGAALEREGMHKSDTLLPYLLPEADLANVRGVAQANARIKRVWVAQKQVTFLPERPMLVIVVEEQGIRLGTVASAKKLAGQVLHSLALSVTADLVVVVLTTNTSWLRKRVESINGARVFHRERS